jgi:hypothetical protein
MDVNLHCDFLDFDTVQHQVNWFIGNAVGLLGFSLSWNNSYLDVSSVSFLTSLR